MKTRPKCFVLWTIGLSLLLQSGCLPTEHPQATSGQTDLTRTFQSSPGTTIPAAPTIESPIPTTSPTLTSTFPMATATATQEEISGEELPGIDAVIKSLAGLPIDTFFEESYRQILLRNPDRLFVNGLAAAYDVPNDRFANISIPYMEDTARLETGILEILRTYDRDSLTPDQQLSYDIYTWYLEDHLHGHQFMLYNFPVNSLTIWGKQNWLVDFMVNYQPLENEADIEDYLARLSAIDTWVGQLIEGLEARAQAGIIPPRYILDASIQQVEQHLNMQPNGRAIPETTQLYTSYLEKITQIESLDTAQKQAWSLKVRDEIEATFIPAYLELRDTLSALLPLANNEGGAWTMPDGDAYYACALQDETSTELTPGEVHALGVSELHRIQQEINDAARELGYSADEIDQRLAEDSPLLSATALQAEFEHLIALADQVSRDQFNLYPTAGLVIQQEPQGSLAYYIPPPFDGSGPGHFYVNLERPTPQYLLPALVFHETIPGHHLQGALTRELDMPTFRKDIEFNAYVEGWALYAERLAWEMGLYEGHPLANLGRLQFEQMRALRLVVDTGVHAMGWTLEEASAQVEQLTGSQINQDYLTRFFVLPGQASGYTIGMLKILELRQRAMERLGEDFDLGEFHALILGNGPMPLEILERVVDDYILARIASNE